jgi:hypothetical protein
MPEFGQHYTREEIAAELGGGVIEYLPNVNGTIVCACLRLDYNPDAPNIILAGHGPEVQQSAEALCEQRGPIPIFIKRNTNAWEYVGDYKVERFSRESGVIAEQEARSGRIGRDGISRVIYMRESP